MSHRYVVIYLLAVAIGFSQTQPPAAQDAGKPGSISGTVRDAGTGTPMPEAEVFVSGESGRAGNTQADAQGHYTFRDLKPGAYRVSAMTHAAGAPGPRPYATRPASLGAGQELTSIDFRLEAFGKLSGKVIDDNGEPVAGISVLLVAREYSLGALRYVFAAMANTDDRGVYSLASVPPGRAYLLYAWKNIRQLKPVSDAPAEARLRKRVAAPTFYPSSDSIEGAAPITLRPGESRDGVNIQVLRTTSYCVDGEVPPTGSEKLEFMIGPAQPTSGMSGDGGFFTMMPSGKVGPDHKLRLCELTPGDYQLTLIDSSQGPAGAPPYFGYTKFTIRDQDVHGIAVNTRVPVKVPGEVVWDGTEPAEPVKAKLRFWLTPLTRSMMGEEISAQPSIPGEFSFSGLLVDGYQVRLLGTPREFYVKEMTYGGTSILHAPLQAGGGVGEAHLRVVLGRDGGFLKAKVADKDGNPVAECFVILMPADALSEAALADEIITGQTDQSGAYSSNALAPGKYCALVSSRSINKSPEDVSKLLQARSHAQEIEIGAGATVSVTLAPGSTE
jgi:hypothetical protein